MAKHIEDEIVYHYDLYPTEEDWMGQTSVHGRLIRYLVDVLTWLFWGQRCALYDRLNFYQTPDVYEYPMSPDIAVIKGVDDDDVTSWRVNKDGPAPQVVFEILSAKTGRRISTRNRHTMHSWVCKSTLPMTPTLPSSTAMLPRDFRAGNAILSHARCSPCHFFPTAVSGACTWTVS